MADLFWLSDAQWAVIEPFMPKNQPGPERKDGRMILSGILRDTLVPQVDAQPVGVVALSALRRRIRPGAIIPGKRGRKRKIHHDKRRYRERARRGHLLPPEGLPSHSHPLRQARPQPCLCRRAGCRHRLLVLTAHRRSTASKSATDGWRRSASMREHC